MRGLIFSLGVFIGFSLLANSLFAQNRNLSLSPEAIQQGLALIGQTKDGKLKYKLIVPGVGEIRVKKMMVDGQEILQEIQDGQ